MKKLLLAASIAFLAVLSAAAQPRDGQPYVDGGSRYVAQPLGNSYSPYYSAQSRSSYNNRYGNNRGYSSRRMGEYYDGGSWYLGFKIGMTASHVKSESSDLSGNRLKSGLSVGMAVGCSVAPMLLFESGLYYVEKGGKSRRDDGRFTYELNYLEVPIMLKYCIYTPYSIVFQPYFGAYLGLGVGGNIKNYSDREAFSSYDDGYFKHGDAGVKIGCGIAYSFFYANIGYDFGLANIGQDIFDDTKNRALRLSIGFAF